MNTTQTSVTSTTSLTSTTSTIPSTAVHCSSHATVSREAHRTHTVFAPIDLVESLTKTNHLLVADMKGELQSMKNQLSTQSTENLKTKWRLWTRFHRTKESCHAKNNQQSQTQS